MFARSSSYSADPALLDAGIAYVKDQVMPMTAAMDGCAGLSMMVDRITGRCIATTSWEGTDSMMASNEVLTPVRERLDEILGAHARVEEWDVVAMHRDHLTHRGCCTRVTWLRTDHADVDRGIDIYKYGVLPRMEELDGFCSASLMVNRGMSRACATASFDSQEAMEASREESWAIRDTTVREAGVDVMDAEEFELTLAHLRVPELT